MRSSNMTTGLIAIAIVAVALIAATRLDAISTLSQNQTIPSTPSSEELAKIRTMATSVSPSHLWRAGRH